MNTIRFFFLFALSTLTAICLHAQIDISEARATGLGTEVTVEGIVTNGFELGIIRYIQDGTAGIAAYPGSGSVGDFPNDVQRGDLVRLRGVLKEFNALLEIDPVLEYEVISSGNPLPAPVVVTPDAIGENLEGQLVTIENANFIDGGSVFGVGNYTFTANGSASEIYIRTNHPLLGENIPLANVSITGIVSQFNSQYQVLPRDPDDIVVVDNFFITEPPRQSDITNDGFSISWETNVAGNSIVRYGLAEALGSEIVVDDMTAQHTVDIDGLDAGEFYYVQVLSDNGNATVESPVSYYSTASASAGTMHVYFNYSVDGSFSDGNYPSTTNSGDMEEAIIEYIDNAQNTIDIAMYNTNRERLVEALSNAHSRGVVVRMIADNETANLALTNPAPPFNLIRGNTEGLMHNKFLVIDRNTVNQSWLLAGSLNFTEQNMANDFNNMIAIQDQALCKAYTLEFEEMWGSDNEVPGIFNVKFGAGKANNTPHLFSVNNILIESYFSPSDNTTAEIAAEIEAADNDVMFALLTFTNNTLGTAVLDAHDRGVNVRGIIDNINDTGSEYGFLTDRGVMVTPDFTTQSTHHKYCVIDPDSPSDDPVVITGSHNWSASAETRNDENTLIIHNQAMANIFRQEFEARWCEAMGGGSSCLTSVEGLESLTSVSLFPNPVDDRLTIKFEDAQPVGSVTVTVFGMNGRVHTAAVGMIENGRIELPVGHLVAGSYVLTVKHSEGLSSYRFVKTP